MDQAILSENKKFRKRSLEPSLQNANQCIIQMNDCISVV